MRSRLALACAALAACAGTSLAQTTITQWNFNSNPADANTNTCVFTPSTGLGTISLFGGATTTCASGDASGGSTDPNVGDDSAYNASTFAGQGAESGERGIELAVSTSNFSAINLTWDQRHSNSSARWIRISFSTDGTTFTTAAEIEATLGGDRWYNSRAVDFSAFPAVNNNPNFKVRIAPIFTPGTSLYDTTTTGSSYGTGGTGGGTQRFDMITFTGTPINSTPPTGAAALSTAAACNTGGTITLVVATQPGASPTSTGIQVSANLTAINGSSSVALSDDGATGGDILANDGIYSAILAVPAGLTLGAKNIPITISDAQLRSSSTSASITIADCSLNSASRVVISQVYGGGSNQGPPAGTFNADFVELFNRSTQVVDLTGWSVQYSSSTSLLGFDNPNDRVLLSGVIRPGQYLLVRMSDPGTIGSTLPTPDFFNTSGDGGMGNTGGRVALVRSSNLLLASCTSSDIEDFVGYGQASICFEGASATANTANDSAAIRVAAGATDRDQNFADFVVAAPTPRNRAAGGFLAGYTTLSSTSACAGSSVTFTVNVSPAAAPVSTGVQVRANLSQLGGGSSVPLADQGGGLFTLTYLIPASVTQGAKSLVITTTDAQLRTDAANLSLTVATCVASSAPVVISQLNGGGGNVGSTWNADFVEIFNRSQSPVDLAGWSLQYASAAGVTGFSGSQQVNLSGIMMPGTYRLIQTNAASPTNGAPIPTADFVALPLFGMDNQFGRVALVNSVTPLGTNYTSPTIVDFLGYGSSAANFEGLAAASTISNTTVALRKLGGCQDFDQNGIDFDVVAPLDLPRNSASPANLCPTLGGRCCIGARCAIVASSSACVSTSIAGASFASGATNCNIGLTFNTPCCFADYNKAGGITVQDIFDFLADWFSNSVNANVAGNGIAAPSVQDIFDFLAAWFSGGCS
jgi:Lamin Tail Domain